MRLAGIHITAVIHNGLGDYGKTHNMYLSKQVTHFTLKHSYSHHAYIGHNVKTRARESYILYNRIMDEGTGRSSYAVDIANDGLTYIIGNLIQQGVDTDNNTIVSYADSDAVDAGTSPGMADGFDLRPHYQYLHPVQRETRQDNVQIDIGAYEYR